MQESHKDSNVSENSVFIFWICEEFERFSSRAIFEQKVFERFSSQAIFEPKIFERNHFQAAVFSSMLEPCSSLQWLVNIPSWHMYSAIILI